MFEQTFKNIDEFHFRTDAQKYEKCVARREPSEILAIIKELL